MKKISLILIAVLCIAFAGCDIGNTVANDSGDGTGTGSGTSTDTETGTGTGTGTESGTEAGTGSETGSGGVKPDPEEPVVTPNELLRNLPVTAADFADMLKTSKRNITRAEVPVEINLAEQNDIALNTSPITTNSELQLVIMKFCVSKADNFEFGKNARIGVIGEAFEESRDELLSVYPSNEVNIYINSFATRDFGTVRIDLNDSKVAICWHLAGWSDMGMNFPDCYLYLNGTYTNGKYENLSVYGEGYSYRTAEDNSVYAVPVFEKTYVSNNKVVTFGQSLDNMDSIENNNLYKIEYDSNSIEQYSISMSNEGNVAYNDSSYKFEGRMSGSNYSCYVVNTDNNLVLKQEKSGNDYNNSIPLTYLSLPDGAKLYREGLTHKVISDGDPVVVNISYFEDNDNYDVVYKNKSTTSTDYVQEPFIFAKADDCTAMLTKFNTLSQKAMSSASYASDLPSKTELDGYQKILSDWKKTIVEE